MEEGQFPNGWIIKAYKHLNTPHADFASTEEFFNSYGDSPGVFRNRRDIAYGNYDRIQLAPVHSFYEYSSESNRPNGWLGSSQSLCLFPIGGNTRRFIWDDSKKRPGLRLDGRDSAELAGFFSVSFCYISDELRNIADSYEELLKECSHVINSLVDAFNYSLDLDEKESSSKLHSPVVAEVLGSFSSAELVILWSSKQYTDILYLMDCLRDLSFLVRKETFSLFRTTFTMVSFPDVIESGAEQDTSLADIQGTAYVQFVMQNGKGEKCFSEFELFFKQALLNSAKLMRDSKTPIFSLRRCVGEYDFVADVQSKYLPRLFSNPQNWNKPNWEINAEDPSYYFCNVHHPKFNQYILYSFTRLGYNKNDLPDFTKEDQTTQAACLWRQKKEDTVTFENLNIRKLSFQRFALLQQIENYRKNEFSHLINEVVQRAPVISNLSTELNQLFSDYVQCCCASADYLWIEDYNELFRQTMDRILQSVQSIEVWKNYTTDVSSDESWRNARDSIQTISRLIRALNQQTSHISASNKLFFKEQDTHFGYTAQHDLVIHAYYDIIKHLSEYIYHYSNKNIQSFLYPLVNFYPESRIVSEIYTEESAEVFLRNYKRTGKSHVLSPRIMVIHIPLDGMDNLMHYLPMMIHEVYHYAAPMDRTARNLLITKIVSFQTLRYSLISVFNKIVDEKSRSYEDSNALNREEMKTQFQNLINPTLKKVVDKCGKAILAGLKEYYFFAESEERLDLDFIENAQILRSWFVVWLQNWLNDVQKRKENEEPAKEAKTPGQEQYNNFSDLIPVVFDSLVEVLEEECQGQKSQTDSIYFVVIETFLNQIRRAQLENESGTTDTDDSIYQAIMEYAAEYVNESGNVSELLGQINELFPDLAMVTLTEMPVAGYMLQIALDCDKQLYHGQWNIADQLRFGVIILYLLKSNSGCNYADEAEKILEQFDEAVKEFKQMYVASYCLSVIDMRSEEESEACKVRANEWGKSFRAALLYHLGASLNPILQWIKKLFEEGMIPCFSFSQEQIKEKQRCFVNPYHAYLDILKKKYQGKDTEDDLFRLNISTILGFQRHKSLKKIHQEFEKKDSRIAPAGKPSGEWAPIVLRKSYESEVFSVENYHTAILKALSQLYIFREEEGITSATGMWYRGVAHADYPVLPSGFVHFAEDAKQLEPRYPDVNYFYLQAQRHNYESFRYSAEGASHAVNPSQYNSTINYLTLMQHYSQHTNLLDWSEDFSASTYFALEDEVNINDKYAHEREKKDKNLPNRKADAALYLLDPIRFNRACAEIEEEGFCVSSGSVMDQEAVPNLSILENQQRYQQYHDLYYMSLKSGGVGDRIVLNSVHNLKQNITLKEIKQKLETISEEQRPQIHLPRAIYAAKLNPRIRAQSGLFVGFSVDSLPAIWSDTEIVTDAPNTDIFYYQSLEAIQEYYLRMGKKRPFLRKIVIPASIKEEMGRAFYRLGVAKERIYPELQNNKNR